MEPMKADVAARGYSVTLVSLECRDLTLLNGTIFLRAATSHTLLRVNVRVAPLVYTIVPNCTQSTCYCYFSQAYWTSLVVHSTRDFIKLSMDLLFTNFHPRISVLRVYSLFRHHTSNNVIM